MTEPSTIQVLRTDVPQVARIVIDRAEAANAFTLQMVRDLAEALETTGRDDDIKAIVIEPAGPDLSVGLEPIELGSHHTHVVGVPDQRVASLRARLRAADEYFWGSTGLYTRLVTCPKVTIVAAAGRCLDVGLNLVLFADIAVGGRLASIGNPRWQHVGVDGDVSMLLATVGRKRANELMLAGATWPAQQALDAGLLNSVVDDPRATGLEIAQQVTTIMRDGIAAEKYLTLASLEKLGVGAGFATATYMTAMSSTIHYRAGELNFLRAKRDHGINRALELAAYARSLPESGRGELR